ncbi:MAG: DUF998 domain-containing protein [Bryobacterales bacterium]|nr:DUF998 domain-containing protein [Bryobacterales bacterium]
MLLLRLSVIVFVATCLLMHIVQPQLSPLEDAVSFYMNGRLGWILHAAIVLLGIGSLQLAYRRGASLLGLWGGCLLLAGMFAPDPPGNWSKPPSVPGMIHGVAAMIAFPSFVIGAVRLSGGPRLRGLAIASAVMLALFLGSLWPAVIGNRPPVLLGLTERLLLALYMAWLWLAAAEATPSATYQTR